MRGFIGFILLIIGLAVMIVAGLLTLARHGDSTARLMIFEARVGGGRQIMATLPGGGAERRLLPSDNSVLYQTWSPDGAWLYYAATGAGGRGDLFRRHLYDGRVEQVTNSAQGTDYFRSWSPDGAWMIVSAEASLQNILRRISPDGMRSEDIASGPGIKSFKAWTPDGEWMILNIADERRDLNIYRARPDGSDLQKLTHEANGGSFVTWSPDGVWIIFEAGFVINLNLFRMQADGSNVQPLTDLGGDMRFLGWDGEWMIFNQSGSDTNLWRIYRARADGREPQRISDAMQSEHSLTRTPDGEWIIFHSTRQGRGDLYRMHPDGSDVQRLTFLDNYYVEVEAWSPDEGFMIMAQQELGERYLYRLSPNGGTPTPLTRRAAHRHETFLDWSPPIDMPWGGLLTFLAGGVVALAGVRLKRPQ